MKKLWHWCCIVNTQIRSDREKAACMWLAHEYEALEFANKMELSSWLILKRPFHHKNVDIWSVPKFPKYFAFPVWEWKFDLNEFWRWNEYYHPINLTFLFQDKQIICYRMYLNFCWICLNFLRLNMFKKVSLLFEQRKQFKCSGNHLFWHSNLYGSPSFLLIPWLDDSPGGGHWPTNAERLFPAALGVSV